MIHRIELNSGVVEEFDGFELLAFEHFEGCSAASGNVAEAIGHLELLDGGGGIATSDDGDRAVALRGISDGRADRLGAGGEEGPLKDAHRTVPDDGFCGAEDGGELHLGLDADIQAHVGAWDVVFEGLHIGTHFGEAGGADVVDGEVELALVLGRGFEDALGIGDAVFLDAAGTGEATQSAEEGVGHGTADEDGLSLGKQVLDGGEFVRNFRAAEDDHERLGGVTDGIGEEFDFLFHQEASDLGGLGHALGNADHTGVGAMGGAEGVVDVDLSAMGELGGKGGIALFLAFMKAHVFEKEAVAILQGLDGSGGFVVDAIA